MSIISPLLLLAVVLMTGSQANPQGTTPGPTQGPTQGPTKGPTQGPPAASSEDDPICAHTTDACNVDVVKMSCPNKCAPPVTCPVGYWNVPESSKGDCYKLFVDQRRNFDSAQSKCASEGGHLAYPLGGHPSALRRFIVETYGHHWPWLGARGNGQTVETVNAAGQAIGVAVTSNSPYWWPGYPEGHTGSSYCLLMLADQSHMNQLQNQPFAMYYCRDLYYPLCQKPVIIQ